LVGLKVVGLGHSIAAPFSTRLLADLGAEVIKSRRAAIRSAAGARRWTATPSGSACCRSNST